MYKSLLNLIKSYSMDRRKLIQKDLKNILNDFELSNRTKNVIKSKKEFQDIESLISYYRREKNFLKIRNCGQKTNRELISLCKKIDSEIEQINYINEIPEFNAKTKTIIQEYIEYEISEISKRAELLFNELMKEKESIEDKLKFILIDVDLDKEKRKRRNIGTGTITELKSLRSKLTHYLNKLEKSNNIEQFAVEFYLKNILKLTDNEIDVLSIDDNRSQFFLFKLCELLINRPGFYNGNELYIFKNYCQYYQCVEKTTLEDISEELNLTRERVRQIRNSVINDFESRFSFLHGLNKHLNIQEAYGIDFKSNIIMIGESLTKDVNSKEDVNFSPLLIAKILNIISKDTHTFIGYELNYHSIQQSKKYISLNKIYLVSDSILEKFRLKKFLKDTEERMLAGIKKTYRVDLRTYMSKYIVSLDLDRDLELIDNLRDIGSLLLPYEFGLLIDTEHKIIFQRNKKRTQSELTKDALEELGYRKEGYHITDIANKIREIAPSSKFGGKIDSIRSAMNRDKTTFIHIGRSSTYGLKKWEDEYDEFKGGTIRDLVQEYLSQYDEPKHISLITKYVNRYRKKTTEMNIEGNLMLDESGTFRLFGQGFIGLKKKEYKNFKGNFESVIGGYFTQQSLRNYLPEFFDDLVTKLSEKYSLKPVQVQSVIEKQIEQGKLKLNSNDIITLN